MRKNGTHLVSAAGIHYEPMGIFPGKDKSATLDKIADGAKIAIPNDTTNEARALQLLVAEGLIELDPEAGLEATPKDVTKMNIRSNLSKWKRRLFRPCWPMWILR